MSNAARITITLVYRESKDVVRDVYSFEDFLATARADPSYAASIATSMADGLITGRYGVSGEVSVSAVKLHPACSEPHPETGELCTWHEGHGSLVVPPWIRERGWEALHSWARSGRAAYAALTPGTSWHGPPGIDGRPIDKPRRRDDG